MKILIFNETMTKFTTFNVWWWWKRGITHHQLGPEGRFSYCCLPWLFHHGKQGLREPLLFAFPSTSFLVVYLRIIPSTLKSLTGLVFSKKSFKLLVEEPNTMELSDGLLIISHGLITIKGKNLPTIWPFMWDKYIYHIAVSRAYCS